MKSNTDIKVNNRLKDILSLLKNLKWYDYLFGGIILIFCFIAFLHRNDVWHTAYSSFSLLNFHITDFYDYNNSVLGLTDEYNIPIYIIYAIWNFPLKILGLTSIDPINSLSSLMYFKILPCLFFMACAIILYKIARQIGCGKKTSFYVSCFFFTAPVAVFSTVMMGCYDSIQLFFVLLGIYYFVREKKKSDLIWAVILFGISFTFKYVSFFVFLPLLLYKNKSLLKCFGLIALSLVPLFICMFPYIFSNAFASNAIGNNYIDRLFASSFNNSFWGTSLFVFSWLFVCAYCYFKPYNADNKYILIYIPLVALTCFFVFVPWHPQWILTIIPYLALTTAINKRRNVYIFLDVILAIVFFALVVNFWYALLDESLLQFGIFSKLNIVMDSSLTMRSFFPPQFMPAYSAMFSCILLINVIFKNPWKFKDSIEIEAIVAKIDWRALRARFYICIPCFIALSLICFLK